MRYVYLLWLLLLPSTVVFAATATDSFTVTATVVGGCVIAVNNLEFGDYHPLNGADKTTPANLDVTCTVGALYNIGLDAGLGAGATVATRKMTNGADSLNYSLFRNAAHSLVWGDEIGTNTMSNTGTGLLQSYTIYGQIFPSQPTVPSGVYSDTITVTVTY